MPPLRERLEFFLSFCKDEKVVGQDEKKRKLETVTQSSSESEDSSSEEEENIDVKKRKIEKEELAEEEPIQSSSTPLTPLQKKISRIERQLSLFGRDTKPILNFKLKELKKKFMTVNDLQNLTLWSIMGHSCTTIQKPKSQKSKYQKEKDEETYDAILFTPRWLHIMNMGLIDKVVFIHMDSLSKDVFEKNKKIMKNLANSMEKHVIPDGIPSKRQPFLLSNPPWSADQANLTMISDKRTANYWRKAFLHRMFKRTVSFCKEKVTKKRTQNFDTLSGTLSILDNSNKKNSARLVKSVDETTDETETTKLIETSDLSRKSKKSTTLEDLLLTLEDLSEHNYPLFQDDEEMKKSKYISTVGSKTEKKHNILALDCEMCLTRKGDELTRVTFVDEDGKVVYDKLVKPHEEIVDYRTMFSGITREMLESVETRLEDVQKEILDIISEDTILLGHSLENDLICLKLHHKRVIDTAVIFLSQSNYGTKYKQSLKSLSRRYLSREIQVNSTEKIGHDSIEDALAALDLVKVVLKEGLEYVHIKEKRINDFQSQENVFEFLSNGEKRSVMVDRSNNMNGILSGSLADAISCTTDEEVFQKSKKFVSKSEYDLVFAHFSELGQYYEKNDFDPVGAPGDNALSKSTNKALNLDRYLEDNETNQKHNTEVKRILENFDRYFAELFEQASPNSLFIVTTGHGNISQIERAFQSQKEWKDLQKKNNEILYLIQNCFGLCFITIK